MNADFKSARYKPVLVLFITALAIFFCTRIILLISFGKNIDGSFQVLLGSIGIGLLYDITVASLLILPFVLQIAFTNNFIYTKKGRWITILFFLAVIFIFLFTNLVPKDFNKELYKGVLAYIFLRFAIYLFLYTRTPSFRYRWRRAVLLIFLSITVFLLIFNAVSEWFFWDEFSSRYNFIAVDYLIYTNEVIGNIRESYPIVSIILTVLIITVSVIWWMYKPVSRSVTAPMAFTKRLLIGGITIGLGILLAFAVSPGWKSFNKNNYANELAGNGIYDFVQAFKNNELDFYTYYKTLPDTTAFRIVRSNLETPYSHFLSDSLFDLRRQVTYAEPERKMNVVLISVESLSASFMQSFGSTKNITPFLDSLATKGMLFTNLYASGTRTVRGLEALSLSIPPLPGQSIVKRPNNENLFSLGSVFKSKGYITQYIYGGYGYFDNMNYFFGNNSYDVIDRTALREDEIHYANIWGVADEDLFTLSLRTMDSNFIKGKPFFSHIMTVSNHRPYTYPENRIDIPPSTQSREGAVKYTDYAIGRFIKEAAAKPWFSNTIFVIVADHCASSAGKQAISLPGYHIPMVIYSPANIFTAQPVTTLTAQIDIAPTVLGLLNFNYTTKFLGQDILRTPGADRRAFVSTYQGLGFIHHNFLTVQSPVKKIKTYQANFATDDSKEVAANDSVTNTAIAFYQVMAWLEKNKKYNRID